MTCAAPTLKPALGGGVYTLPDAAAILRLPLSRLRSWVGGYLDAMEGPPPGILSAWGKGRARAFNFHVLIEAYTVYSLRKLGVSMPRIRGARDILTKRLKTCYPFAIKGILAQGGRVLLDLAEEKPGALLHLAPGQQTEFREIISPFCTALDFARQTGLAERFWPLGKDKLIVVDPRVSFGRPVIMDTGITAEAIASLVSAGESPADVAAQFNVSVQAVEQAHSFIHPRAA